MRLTFPAVLALLLFVCTGAQTGSAQTTPKAQLSENPEQLLALADQVARDVENLRGWTFKHPVKKEVTTVAQALEYLRQQVDKDLPAGRAQEVQAFLRTAGLLSSGADLKLTWLALLENQVGGYYDPDTKSMHLVARAGTPPVIERVVLAHELTHALDDQYVDLSGLVHKREQQNATEDQELASTAVVEGSATALMMQYMTREMAPGRFDLGQLKEYAQREAERSKPFLAAPRYFSAMLASYICGTQFLAKGQLMSLLVAPDDRAIGEALIAARKDPPRSTEQILHPDKYWDPAARDEPVMIDDGAATKWLSRPGRWVVHADTVGEMLTAILTSPSDTRPNIMAMQSADAWTNQAATGWGGDRFYLLATGDTLDAAKKSLKDPKGVWVTTWDSPRDRDEFLAAIPKGSMPTGAAAVAVGKASTIVYIGIDAAEQDALTAQLRQRMLPMTKGGVEWKN